MAERRQNARTRNGQASRPTSMTERLQPWWPRLGKAALLVMLMVVMAGLVRWIEDPRTLPLRQVQIEGSFRHLSRSELQAQVMPYAVGGFFSVDVAAIQQAAQELSWVDRVSVRRVWPDTVRIHVYEQQPVARWGDADLLNGRGEVFATAGHEVQEDLVQLQGPAGREQALLVTYQKLADVLSASQLRIVRLSQDQRRALELTLNTGVKVQLGRNEALTRIRRFMRAYSSLMASREETLQRVDLRYSNGFAVRWMTENGKQKS